MRKAGLVCVLSLAACDRLDTVGATVSPVVVQGIFLGAEIPEGLDLEGSELMDYSAACTVYLASLTDPAEVEQAPLEGERVQFRSGETGSLDLADAGEGKYVGTAGDGLVYAPGDTASVRALVDDEPVVLSVRPPEAPEVDLPGSWTALEDLRLDLSGENYQNVLAAVYNLDQGRLTFDNLPDTVDETYAFTHPESPTESLIIPGESWKKPGTYVVGVAGMKMADPEEYEGVNTTVSAFMAGMVSLHFLVVEE